jgi:hypothetical protein
MLLVVGVVLRRTPQAVLRVHHLIWLALLFVFLQVLWPAINEWTLLAGSRGLSDQVQAGQRPTLWWALLDAVFRQPLWGYGWQQVPSAQWAVALDHAPLQRYFEHSHNIALDLLIWAGVPVGGCLVVLAGIALWRQTAAIDDARARWLLVAVMGVLVHALLEFPLEYAYFLLPVGLVLGALHTLHPGQASLRIPLPAAGATFVLLGVMLTVVVVDYFEVEQNYRTTRLEATFGSRQIETPAPQLLVLSNLQAYLEFIRTEARPGMTPFELQRFKDVAQRYAHPPALLRLALAEGLNGEPLAATDTLRRICAMHTQPRCEEARDSWHALQSRYPQLGAVPAPAVPGH